VRVRQKVKGKGKPWWVFVSHNGKRTSRKVGDKKAAEKVASTIRAKLQLGEFGIEKPRGIPTFGEYADKWLQFVESDIKSKDPEYKKSTYIEHETILRLYILPAFKDHKINTITTKHILDFLIPKLGELSKSRVMSIKGVMSNVFSIAVDDSIIDTNPTLGISKSRRFPGNGKRKSIEETEVYTPDEVELLLNTCKTHFSEYYPFFLTALRTGMRLGELLALEWDDIDFNSKYIWIKRSYRRGRTTTTKTEKTRQVDMSNQLVVALKDYLRVCKEDALKQGRGNVTGLVFDYGKSNIQNFIRRQYMRILKKTGLRYVKFHGLRHAFCAHLLSKGISPYYVSKQAGHTSINITCDTYGSWIRDDDNRHVNALDSMHQSDPYVHPETDENPQVFEISKGNILCCQ
jgi:integrase